MSAGLQQVRGYAPQVSVREQRGLAQALQQQQVLAQEELLQRRLLAQQELFQQRPLADQFQVFQQAFLVRLVLDLLLELLQRQ